MLLVVSKFRISEGEYCGSAVTLHSYQPANLVNLTIRDITLKTNIERVHELITQTMPPIAGVANGALVLRDKSLIKMDLDTFHMNTRPKVEGTTYLDELFPKNTLDWFIAFSSIAATIGNHGQMAYTAANMFMKALVAQRRYRGLAGSVIDISQVLGVGYIERELKARMSREQAIRLTSRSGTLVMSEPDLHQLFAEAILAGRAGSSSDHELITGIKIITSDEAKEAHWGKSVRFGHFIQDIGAVRLPSLTTTATVSVKTQLEATKDVEERSAIVKGEHYILPNWVF
jgi:hypothetical protein